MLVPSFSKIAAGVLICLVLAGCKSDAERAEEYFQSGLELLEAGDVDRAMVEFRNVFEFQQNHLEARLTVADVYLEQDNLGAAYGQFLYVVEQYPDQFRPRVILSELAFGSGDWEEFARHGEVAVEMQPDNLRVQAIDLGLKYRDAVLDEDDPARQALVTPSVALLTELPENAILNSVLLDSYVRDGAFGQALERIDIMLAQSPNDRQLNARRLSLLAQMQDEEGLEQQLRDMVERFPDDSEVQSMLFRFYVSQQRLDEAESFLRGLSDPADEDPALFLNLVRFVGQVHGTDAARAEIERAVAVNPNPNPFKGMLAMMDFQAGQQDQAIADLEAILADAEPTLEETENLKIMLARMLVQTNNQVGARRLVEEVLAQNPANVEGLKMQALWQLQADDVDAALVNLRLALDGAPEDVQVMNLMYEAYTRLGDTNLARDYLALAAEVSGNAPEPSVRYARLLISEERYLPAEDVLLPALRQTPENVELLSLLGELYLRMEDFARATQVIETLNRIDVGQSQAVAAALQAEMLNRQAGTEEAVAYLEELAGREDAGLRERLVLMRARLQLGDTEEALAIAEELVAENPDNLRIRLALANAQSAHGDLDAADATLLDISAAAPQAQQPWVQRIQIAYRQGDVAKADALTDEALEATNRHPNIMWVKASTLERNGDIDGAIGIYEELYAQNSGNVIVANNLASLLATYKNDDASLERAWVVGRRLQGADNPALQDTYGWLLYRRGAFEEALPYLESAAAALEDPVVQAHLGFTYAALDRNDEALNQLQRAIDLAGPADTRERIELARAEVTRLRSLPEN